MAAKRLEEDKLLIEKVQANEALYNKDSPLYSNSRNNIEERTKIWKSISKTVKLSDDKEAKERWNAIRSSYVSSKKKEGARYKYADMLGFLDQHISIKDSEEASANLQGDHGEEDKERPEGGEGIEDGEGNHNARASANLQGDHDEEEEERPKGGERKEDDGEGNLNASKIENMEFTKIEHQLKIANMREEHEMQMAILQIKMNTKRLSYEIKKAEAEKLGLSLSEQ